ncbi:hypothetical protein NPIL_206451 [Nephila pilipes]|uniref:Uncharacterized protein n=1 Tax=Nephila pilipes TaxID=299642 RepID=A0A8X6QG24_NEPPI|nr:hypothetical protein NPIL_206451 [Nephila pilipes]
MSWSFLRIRDEPYVLSQKKQNTINQIKMTKIAQEVLWKCKVAEMKVERDALKAKEYECKIEQNILKTERESLSTENARLKRVLTSVA